jgi:hypothetical protein
VSSEKYTISCGAVADQETAAFGQENGQKKMEKGEDGAFPDSLSLRYLEGFGTR